MNVHEELILQLWEIISHKMSVKDRNEICYEIMKAFYDNDIDVLSMNDLYDVDDHIDYALNRLKREENGDDSCDNDENDDSGEW